MIITETLLMVTLITEVYEFGYFLIYLETY